MSPCILDHELAKDLGPDLDRDRLSIRPHRLHHMARIPLMRSRPWSGILGMGLHLMGCRLANLDHLQRSHTTLLVDTDLRRYPLIFKRNSSSSALGLVRKGRPPPRSLITGALVHTYSSLPAHHAM